MFAIWTTQDVVAWLTLLQVWGSQSLQSPAKSASYGQSVMGHGLCGGRLCGGQLLMEKLEAHPSAHSEVRIFAA
jgi:hypothetical protein